MAVLLSDFLWRSGGAQQSKPPKNSFEKVSHQFSFSAALLLRGSITGTGRADCEELGADAIVSTCVLPSVW